MSDVKNLLVELFVEELPPKALRKLGEAFAVRLYDSLSDQHLISPADTIALTENDADPAPYASFASPRRLAVHVIAVRSRAEDMVVSQKLMPVSVGLNAEGHATPALLKRLASVGATAADVPKLKRQMDGKAEALFFDSLVKGTTLAEGLQKALHEALAKLPIPKVMQYQLADGWTSVNFVRPAHGLVALYGDDVVPVQALGLTAGRATHGHRFEASVDPIELTHADGYAQQLAEKGAVIASFTARRDEIARQLNAAAAKQGLTPIDDSALLDEVTALVERPNVLTCQFETEFLGVPQECLILTMKANQKYFPLLDAAGKLTNQFLVVSNITPTDASRVVEGNERVVRPRLADAKFFFDQDRKRTLESRVPGLDKVVYHGKLGTQGERVQRVRAIAQAIGRQLGGDGLAAQADRAALLAKADLLTDMVGEFPELQGIMGGYYAAHDGETGEVAQAVEDHYKPRFAGDALPRNLTGVVVALADKLETLVGLFGIGQVPTGDKDPFALRRHALGVIRLLVEKQMPIGLNDLIDMAVPTYQGLLTQDPRAPLGAFVMERLAVSLRDDGYSAQQVDSVLSLDRQHLADVRKRLEAVRMFARLPEAVSLAAANKRVSNLLKKNAHEVRASVSPALLHEEAEKTLAAALALVSVQANAQYDGGDYAGSLQTLAALRTPVDAFFESVMVNAEDPALRANRLGLLAQLHAAMNRVADLSKLAS